jgi:AraC-like DNA-binding protein
MFNIQIDQQILEVSHKRIEKPNQSIYYNHIHNHCELLLFISGKANYNIDGQIYSPAPYDLLFVPAATYHYLIPTASIPYENYVIGVDPSFIAPEHYKKLFSAPLMISIKDDPQLLDFFTRLDHYRLSYSEEDFKQCAVCLIRELITYCYYHKEDQLSASNDTLPYINNIVSYINNNLEMPLCAEGIAQHFLLSKSYVQNLFSQNMHIGLKKYIMQKKIYAAHADLIRGMTPIQVCEKYAFGDYSVFYRLYKQTFAASPRNQTKQA